MPDMWLFLDGAGGQQGPVHTKILQRLVCRTDGIPSMAWQEGMEKWEPLTSLENFSKLIQTSYKPWSYLDVNNATVGPMKVRGTTSISCCYTLILSSFHCNAQSLRFSFSTPPIVRHLKLYKLLVMDK